MSNKLVAVLWKNLLIRRNAWALTLFELLFPLALLLLMNIYLPAVPNVYVPDTRRMDEPDDFQHASSILYSPSNTFTDTLMKTIGPQLGYKSSHTIPGNLSELLTGEYNYGIDFGDSSEDQLTYTIYPGSGSWPDSLPDWKSDAALISNSFTKYSPLTLAKIQYNIDRIFMKHINGGADSLRSQQDFQTLRVEDMDKFSRDANPYGTLTILVIFMSYSIMVSPVITRIVEEKECGAKELMRMMGVKSWQLWLGKLLDSVAITTIVSLGMVFLLYVPLTSTSTVIHFVNPFIYFIMLLLGMTSIIIALFFLSCFFDSPMFASTTASIVGIGSVMLVGVVTMTSVAHWRRLLYCLLPHMTIIFSANILNTFEQYEKEVKWFERVDGDGNSLSLAEVLSMMIFDIILYSLLTWYFDKTRPGKFGIPLPWHFFLNRSFWCPEVVTKAEVNLLKNKTEAQPSAGAGIFVHQLRKVFREMGQAPVVAVDCLNLEAPEGRITALLGHNGAGKTTTMQIITGLITATSGAVSISGYDIRTNPDQARASLGLCPQQDLLFPNLTALQTLTFFAMIKGLTYCEGKKEAEKLLETLKMSESKNKLNKDLSGGTKRKVSLGIALVGGSKVVILDEPTAGVDAELRREICDLLLSFRGERTVLLTTHIMEEADAISDMIFIMDHGKVQCSGTPLDLKTKFGTGYTLQVVTKKEEGGSVMDIVKKTVPDSRFKSRNAATLTFQLPSIQTPVFSQLFALLDEMQLADHIVSYSLSISTLEDVFVRVREMEKEASADEVDGSPYHILSSNVELNPGKLTGSRLWLAQFWALLIKCALTFKRSIWVFLGFAGIPFAMIILSETLSPLLSSMASTPTVRGFAAVNYSGDAYSKREIYIQTDRSCADCATFERNFAQVVSERNFYPIYNNDVDEAIAMAFKKDFQHYSRNIAMSVKVSPETIIVEYNNMAPNMISVATNLIHNAMLRRANNNTSISTGTSLKYITRMDVPTPSLPPEQTQGTFIDVIGFQTLYYLMLMQTERKTGAKALQLMAVPAYIYWVAHFLFDLLTFLLFITITSLSYYFFEPNDEIFVYSHDFPLAVTLWGGGLILISYIITCFIKTKANAISVAILVYVLGASILVTFIQLNLIPTWTAGFHPTAMWRLGISGMEKGTTYLYAMAGYWIVMLAFLIMIESTISSRMMHSLFSKVRTIKYNAVGAGEIDADVDAEDEQVTGLMQVPERTHDTLLVSRLRRWYGLFRPKPAVRGVSFRVQPGECFGLLGVNGAGKSSTFNMLTTQIACSGGDAVLNQAYLSAWNTNKYLSQMSYCPQTSGIIPKLTGREFLTLFARLRGYKEHQVADIIFHWIKVLDLEECSERLCGRYSGGMERKLIAAAAFVWDACVVMLDEPTSGVDPVARRSIWKAVTSAQQAEKSIVLTSHSMEECEALCSRLAIMVDGSFRCIGETTTLKNKFGGGYSVQAKISPCSAQELAAFEKAVKEALGTGCHLTDRHCSILHYHIDGATTNWKTLFAQLEELQSRFPVLESYMASETTLEEIFLAFAGHRKMKFVEETVVDISE